MRERVAELGGELVADRGRVEARLPLGGQVASHPLSQSWPSSTPAEDRPAEEAQPHHGEDACNNIQA